MIREDFFKNVADLEPKFAINNCIYKILIMLDCDRGIANKVRSFTHSFPSKEDIDEFDRYINTLQDYVKMISRNAEERQRY